MLTYCAPATLSFAFKEIVTAEKWKRKKHKPLQNLMQCVKLEPVPLSSAVMVRHCHWPEECIRRHRSWAWLQTDSLWRHPTTASGLWTLAVVQRIAGIPSQESWCLLQKNGELSHRTLGPYNAKKGLATEGWNNDCKDYSSLEQHTTLWVFSL